LTECELEILKLEEKIKKLEKEVIKYKYDRLTGLETRNDFDVSFSKYMLSEAPFYLTLIDINGLKFTNDNYGYQEGDKLIKSVAQELSKSTDGLVYRYGGDEFTILSLDKPIIPYSPNKVCYTVSSEDYNSASNMFIECNKKLRELKDKFYKENNIERRVN